MMIHKRGLEGIGRGGIEKEKEKGIDKPSWFRGEGGNPLRELLFVQE